MDTLMLTLDRNSIASILDNNDEKEAESLFKKAYNVKRKAVGEKVYLRGLVEISNKCRKNCLYCGIRSGNHSVNRYEISLEEVLAAARFAAGQGYASIVIQGGERTDKAFLDKITCILKEISKIRPDKGENSIGITLSLGEQPLEIYQEWFDAGARRYLLRIEASGKELYEKIHPADGNHCFETRIQALKDLRKCGYQVGTGVMIGLPFQTSLDLADDLFFFKDMDIDMCGMGPYIEHSMTPLYGHRSLVPSIHKRMDLSLKMVALLRIMMPDINIAATTAMQALDPMGREKAIMAGANVLMPNITAGEVRADYQIYQNKPGIGEDAAISSSAIETRLSEKKIPIGYGQWGDSLHFGKRSGH